MNPPNVSASSGILSAEKSLNGIAASPPKIAAVLLNKSRARLRLEPLSGITTSAPASPISACVGELTKPPSAKAEPPPPKLGIMLAAELAIELIEEMILLTVAAALSHAPITAPITDVKPE